MYRLYLFEKLIIRRGLKFCLPPGVSPIGILARFENAYWRIEPLLEENDKELAQRYAQLPQIVFSVQALIHPRLLLKPELFKETRRHRYDHQNR